VHERDERVLVHRPDPMRDRLPQQTGGRFITHSLALSYATARHAATRAIGQPYCPYIFHCIGESAAVNARLDLGRPRV
jgi:hypothetical protein